MANSQTDIGPDTPLVVSDARHYFPGDPHSSTVRKWLRDGFVVRVGEYEQTVTLEGEQVGGRWFTTCRMIQAFRAALLKAKKRLRKLDGRDT